MANNLELKELSQQELESLVLTKKQKLRELRFDKVVGKLEKTNDIKNTRRDIARILTRLTQVKKEKATTKEVTK